jgi:hypothetical protein
MSQVPGLLLFNSRGQAYFIEGGIKADRLEAIKVGAGSRDVVSFRPIDPSVLRRLEDDHRKQWFNENNVSENDNLGPFLLEAYSVFLTRDDDGNDSEITGNGSTLEPPVTRRR